MVSSSSSLCSLKWFVSIVIIINHHRLCVILLLLHPHHHQHHIILRLLYGDSTRPFIYIGGLRLAIWETDRYLSLKAVLAPHVPSSTSICLERVWNLRPSAFLVPPNQTAPFHVLIVSTNQNRAFFTAPTKYSDHLGAPFFCGRTHQKK